VAVLIFQFLLPFSLLLSREGKRNPRRLRLICICIVAGECIEQLLVSGAGFPSWPLFSTLARRCRADCTQRRLVRGVCPLRQTAAALASSKSSLRVARVVALDAARQQTFAAALAAARKCRSAALRLHAGAETVLAFARALG
jgi:hypothetical protein